MKKHINQLNINKIEIKSKPYEIWDTRCPNFLIRVQPSGSKAYVVQYRRGRRITLGKVHMITPSQGRDLALELLGLAAAGATDDEIRRAARPSAGLTFEGFIDGVYSEWMTGERKTGAATVQRLKATFYRDFRGIRLENISAFAVERWRRVRKQAGIRPSTTNRDLASLKAALSKAVQWGKIDKNPIASVRPDRLDKTPVTRRLSPEEAQRLRAALAGRAGHIVPIVLIALNCGLRRGEIFGLHWTDIDLAGRVLTVEGAGAKSAQTRHVPLNSEAFEALSHWRRQGRGEDHVFPGRDHRRLVNIDKAWHKLLRDSGIEDFTFHCLRHSFGSDLVDADVPLYVVKTLMGHSTLAITERYAHLADNKLQDAVNRLGQDSVAAIHSVK